MSKKAQSYFEINSFNPISPHPIPAAGLQHKFLLCKRGAFLPRSRSNSYSGCALLPATEEHEIESWNSIRNWLQNNRNNAKLLAAAVNNQEEGETSLRAILRKCPPLDVVREMIEIAPNLLRLPNSNGLLPLHIACHSASMVVVDELVQGTPITVRIGDSV